MKYLKSSIFLSAVLGLMLAVTAFAQGDRFNDPEVDYSFELPDAKWKMTVKPSATVPNVEYVYIDRNDGHLEVRKLTVPANTVLSDVIRDEEQKLQFQRGFAAGKEENFGGFLKGAAYNFEFLRSGRPMSGRYYFLKANDTTIYVLRFTGFRDNLRSIRNQTDSIARTFQLKKS